MSLAIITPVYNRANSIIPTLLSVTSQQDKLIIEHIVVSDGCEDYEELINTISSNTDQEFCKLVRLNANLGTGAAINAGVRASKADWIMTLDSDDVLTPYFVKKISKIIESDILEFDFYYLNVVNSAGSISPNPKPCSRLNYRRYLIHLNQSISKNHEKGLVARRKVYESVKLPENYAYEDLFHLEINKRFRGKYIDEVSKNCSIELLDRLSEASLKITSTKDLKRILGQTLGYLDLLFRHFFPIVLFSPKYAVSLLQKTAKRILVILLYRVKAK
jgi:glycosyltransferase involved in cell wall biosynthesis